MFSHNLKFGHKFGTSRWIQQKIYFKDRSQHHNTGIDRMLYVHVMTNQNKGVQVAEAQ